MTPTVERKIEDAARKLAGKALYVPQKSAAPWALFALAVVAGWAIIPPALEWWFLGGSLAVAVGVLIAELRPWKGWP
jgi:hypothetical protein